MSSEATARALARPRDPLSPDEPERARGPAPTRRGQLWVALHLPALMLEAVRGPDPANHGAAGRPAAVIAGGEGRAPMLAVDRAAARAGVSPGMSADAACVLAPGLELLQRDAQAEAAALGWLAAWGRQFTSFTSLAPPAEVLLEIGGSIRLFGGLDALLGRLRDDVQALGYTVRSGVAPYPEAARLLARAGDTTPVLEGGTVGDRLARVSLECLGLSEHALLALRRMGVRTFGDCRRLPRDGVSRRVGRELVELLDRACGERPQALARYQPPRVFERLLPLPEGARDLEVLLAVARRALMELAGFLAGKGEGASRLELHVFHQGAPASRMSLRLTVPSRDPEHLAGLLRERLERLDLGTPGVALGLRVPETAPTEAAAADLFGRADGTAEGDWAGLLDWLQARLGAGAIGRVQAHADHRPERAWGWVPAGRSVTPCDAVAEAPRPLWLLAEPAALRLVDGGPWHDGVLRIEHGPERIESGWWDGRDVARDYFVARGPCGERLWIYRDLRAGGDWFLHGLFG